MKTFSVFLALFLIFSPFLYAEDEKAEEEEVKSLTEERRDILLYGIDSQVIDLLEDLEEEKDDGLVEEAAEIYRSTLSRKVKQAVLAYFSEIDYTDAATDVLDDLVTYDEDDLPPEVISASIRYISEAPEGKKKDATDLFMELCRHEDDMVSQAAIQAVGLCDDRRCVDFLLELYEDDDMSDPKKGVILKSLGTMGAKEAVPLLEEILANEDEERSLRWNACQALGAIADEDTLPALRNALGSDDTYLRSYAVAALKSFEGEEIEALLIQALKDSFWRVRTSAAETLGERGSKAAIPILIFKADKDPENNVRLAALKALGTLGSSEALDYIRSVFEDKRSNPALRLESAGLLIENDLEGSFETVETVLADSWEDDNKTFLNTLGKHLSLQEYGKLDTLFEKMLDHPELTMRLYAIRGIARNNFSRLKPRIEALSEEGNPAVVRKEALAALEKM